MRAIKATPLQVARDFGTAAIRAIRSGQHIRARDMALTAVHHARIAIARGVCPNLCAMLDTPTANNPARYCPRCGYRRP